MSFSGGFGAGVGSSFLSRNDSMAVVSKQQQQQAAAAAADSVSQTSSKQLLQAAQQLERELEHDEKRDRVWDELTSHDNGAYRIEKNRMELRRTVAIPQAITEQYADLECQSYMGLLPSIHRAYITMDNKLFLWNYYDGSDFFCYDELAQIVIAVALLPPKPGVFVSSIRHVLVVSTPVEIMLFAVRFEGDNVHGAMQLCPTQFTVPSDGVHMTSIVGTPEGGILLAGRDGGIYGLDYWSSEGWGSSGVAGGLTSSFSTLFLPTRRKAKKVQHTASSSSNGAMRLIRAYLPTFLGGTAPGGEHIESMVYDPSRRLLYTLSVHASNGAASRSVVSMYDYSSGSLRLRARQDRVLESARSTLRQVSVDLYSDLAPGAEADFKLVSLLAIPAGESATTVLIGVTSHGHRFLFEQAARGMELRVRAVRLAPPATSAADDLRYGARAGSSKVEPRFAAGTSPALVHAAYYKSGLTLLADGGRSARGDCLISLTREPRPPAASATSAYNTSSWNLTPSFSSNIASAADRVLNESVDSLTLDVRATDIGEVARETAGVGDGLGRLCQALFARAAVRGNEVRGGVPQVATNSLPELATQHLAPARQMLVLTASSLHLYRVARPLDELRTILANRRRGAQEEAPLRAFGATYGAKEAASMCLILVCASFGGSSSGGAGGEYEALERRSTTDPNSNGTGTLVSIASPNKLLGASNMPGASGAVSEEQLRKSAKQAFFRLNEMAQEALASSYNRANAPQVPAKLESVALYLSRWMRVHWDWSLCIPATPTGGLAFRFGREFYVELLQPLTRLQRFLEEHSRMLVRADASSSALPPPAASAAWQASGLADPARMEAESFQSLSALLNLSIEVFHLMILLQSLPSANGGASLLTSSPFLASSDLTSLVNTKLCDVLTSPEGHELVRRVVNTLASLGAGSATIAGAVADQDTSMTARGKRSRRGDEFDDEASSNALIAQLHTSCPSFFSSSSLLYYNALECLARAQRSWNLPGERANHIAQAMQIYRSGLPSPTFPLDDVVNKLKSVHAYEGACELAMQRAEMIDRGEIAFPPRSSSASSMAPQSDERDLQKKRCFDAILDIMNVLVNTSVPGSKSLVASSNGVQRPGALALDAPIPPLSAESLQAVRDRVLARLLSSPDPALHAALYRWYLDKKLLDQLYALRSTDQLLRFLTSSEEHVLILKDFYLVTQKWHEAALLLNFLSLKQGQEYTLDQRLEFLTRALQCARNASQIGSSPAGRSKRGAGAASLAEHEDLISQLADRIEIAKIQADIYKKLQRMLAENYSEAEQSRLSLPSARSGDLQAFNAKRDQLVASLAQLDSQLLDLQALYATCTTFGLWECCLSIFKFSNESQRSDVICALWKNIFRAEMAACKRQGVDWGEAVAAKFISLVSDPGTNYREVDFMFPLEFLVKELEINNFRYRQHPENDYVSETLLQAGIPPAKLLSVYENLLDNWDQSGSADASSVNAHGQHIQAFLYWSVLHILKKVIDQERASTSRRGPSAASSSAASVFTKVKANLRTLPPSETTTRLSSAFQQLYDQFRANSR